MRKAFSWVFLYGAKSFAEETAELPALQWMVPVSG